MVRYKNRYITVELLATIPENKPLKLKSKVLHDTLLDKIQHMHGDFGAAAVRNGFLTKYCNENTRIAILRSRHGPHQFVTSTIPFITKIGGLPITLRTLHVGATMKHSFKFILKHQRSYLDKMWSKLKTDEERRDLEKAVMDFTKTDVSINIDNIG
ncbi:ribonuclease P/MRP protein subunit POP5 [Aricia agestis]|uniref:ribonuclease P/MRP protein subunit POP5 n=1 Tax=Aricia agestis TaxID=91739 RepID=UPI001C201637|nr:ribonuclease P/MRP protein subunit POP5 [Aricia agestis]XP_041977770.1 ribonuclease P/MRP protein subunit POP5 [Aricia agestis]